MMRAFLGCLVLAIASFAQAQTISALVTWEFAIHEPAPAPVRFTLYRSTDDRVTWHILHDALDPTARTYRDTALAHGQRYCYQISVRYPPSFTSKKLRSKKMEWAPEESAPVFLGCQETPSARPLPGVSGGSVRREE